MTEKNTFQPVSMLISALSEHLTRANPMNEPKYFVEVKTADATFKVDKQKLSQVKKVVRGKKFIREVQKQYVNCPVFKRDISFLDCFNCKNFLRRIKGQVHCRGIEGVRDPALPLQVSGDLSDFPATD